jgi:hypothetical protein
MHIKSYSKKVSVYETLFVILNFVLNNRKSAPWDYENLHQKIRILKLNESYKEVLGCFSFDNLGISPISNDIVDSLFTLTNSNLLLLILSAEDESFTIRCSEEKKKAIFSKFSKDDLNLLSEIAEKISN